MSAPIKIQIYPAYAVGWGAALKELIVLPVYCLPLFTLACLIVLKLDGWKMSLALVALLVFFMKISTDWLVTNNARARCMGYGLTKSKDTNTINYFGFCGECAEFLSHQIIATPIDKLSSTGNSTEIFLKNGSSLSLNKLGSDGQELFYGLYNSLRENIDTEEIVQRHPQLKGGRFRTFYYREGGRRPPLLSALTHLETIALIYPAVKLASWIHAF